MRNKTFGVVALAGFVGCVWLANWMLTTYGFWHLPGTPYSVPAGVYVVGLSFGLRDAVQERLGPWWVLPGIAAGAALSCLLSDPVVTPEGIEVASALRVAVASGIAFTLSELADFAFYTPLRNRSWTGAVAVSNVVGAVTDSVLFLWLCFGSLDFVQGQVIGKVAMTAFAFPIVWWARRRRR
jgi:uncharacterized PurR-regulated membrane protein YhhQ (DUF165 family)